MASQKVRKRLLSSAVAAEIVGVGQRRLQQLTKDGKIYCYEIESAAGRAQGITFGYDKKDLDAFNKLVRPSHRPPGSSPTLVDPSLPDIHIELKLWIIMGDEKSGRPDRRPVMVSIPRCIVAQGAALDPTSSLHSSESFILAESRFSATCKACRESLDMENEV